jgi:hypothetical protein
MEFQMSASYLTRARLREIADALSDRDYEIIGSVSNLRFVSGGQLARLCFSSETNRARAARRALKRLCDLGVLERLPRPIGGVRAGSAGFVYRLSPIGQRLTIQRGWQSDRRIRRYSVPGSLFVAHALDLAELNVRLVEAERRGRFELLSLQTEPTCWRSYGLAGQDTLKPDVFVRVGIGAFEDSYFIEVDRGSEGSRALTDQLKRYVGYHGSGQEQSSRGVFPRTLWLVPDRRRAEVIGRCIDRLPKDRQELFSVVRFEEAVDLITSAESEINNSE